MVFGYSFANPSHALDFACEHSFEYAFASIRTPVFVCGYSFASDRLRGFVCRYVVLLETLLPLRVLEFLFLKTHRGSFAFVICLPLRVVAFRFLETQKGALGYLMC